MTLDPEAVLQENMRRRRKLEVDYDPIRGIGSPIDRFRFVVGDQYRDLWLPMAMTDHRGVHNARKCGSLQEYAHRAGKTFQEAYGRLQRDRAAYDFEFWAASLAKIKDKSGEETEFVLNVPQRRYLGKLEAQRLAGEPVRQVLLKHRQWGATTLTLSYLAWFQIELFKGRDAWFVGQDKDASKNVLARYDRIRENYTVQDLELRPYQGMANTKIIPTRDATVSVGTVKNPNAPSGRTPQLIHLTEIGKWPSNAHESAEKLVSNMESMLVDQPGTIGIMESTMQGDSGTYFKKLCDLARRGKTSSNFWFASWTSDPQYRLPAGHSRGDLKSYDVADIEAFISQWTEYDRMLWNQMGCTLAQINWYRHQRKKPGYVVKPYRLKEEFPTTADEAFQVGEDRVFPQVYVNAAMQTCKEPEARGRLYGAAKTGGASLEDPTFEEEPYGKLKLWRRPYDEYSGLVDAYTPEKTTRIANRYCMASDVGPGQSRNADFHNTAVLDRAPILWGAHPEIVADWHGHLDVDLYAWEMARLGKWYDWAYWAIEVNSLHRKKGDREAEYGKTVAHEVKQSYGNLYHRTVVDRATGDQTRRVGWHMTSKNKGVIVSALNSHLRGAKELQEGEEAEKAIICRDEEACQEMDHFLEVEGTMQAAPGEKDDRVDVRCLLAHLNDQMPAPSPITEHEPSEPQAGTVNI
jgi:hypothetical protein